MVSFRGNEVRRGSSTSPDSSPGGSRALRSILASSPSGRPSLMPNFRKLMKKQKTPEEMQADIAEMVGLQHQNAQRADRIQCCTSYLEGVHYQQAASGMN